MGDMHRIGRTPTPRKAAAAPRRLLCPDLAAAQRTKNPRPRARPPGTDPPPPSRAPDRAAPPPPQRDTPRAGPRPEPPPPVRPHPLLGRPFPSCKPPPGPSLSGTAHHDAARSPAGSPSSSPTGPTPPALRSGPAAEHRRDAGTQLCGGWGISSSAPDGAGARLARPMGARAGAAGRGGVTCARGGAAWERGGREQLTERGRGRVWPRRPRTGRPGVPGPVPGAFLSTPEAALSHSAVYGGGN